MSVKIIDTNNVTTSKLAQLKQMGVETIIRYITTNTVGEKCVKPEEARAMAIADIKLGLVFEVWGGSDNFRHNDINADTGRSHGQFAASWAPRVGAPSGTIIWFAIDNDASPAQIARLVLPYFRSVREAMGGAFRVGIYGPGDACRAVVEDGAADAAWLSNAMGWSGSRAYRDSRKWTLLQHLETNLLGLSIDPNEANGDDYGQFVPWGQKPVIAAVDGAETGIASWYDVESNGGTKTASGEALDDNAMTAAHLRLAFGTMVKVTRVDGKVPPIVVRINDRGPYKKGRIIDLTHAGASALGILQEGTTRVKLEVEK